MHAVSGAGLLWVAPEGAAQSGDGSRLSFQMCSVLASRQPAVLLTLVSRCSAAPLLLFSTDLGLLSLSCSGLPFPTHLCQTGGHLACSSGPTVPLGPWSAFSLPVAVSVSWSNRTTNTNQPACNDSKLLLPLTLPWPCHGYMWAFLWNSHQHSGDTFPA